MVSKTAMTTTKFGLGKTLLVGAAIVGGAMAIKAFTSGGEAADGGPIGSMSMGGEDDIFDDEDFTGILPEGVYPETQEDTVYSPMDVALVDAAGIEEVGTGSNSEGLYDPNDNPFPQAGGQYDTVGDISRFTTQPSVQDEQQADFLTKHPVAGWSLIGASLVPSWFSSKSAKYGETLAESIRPTIKTADTLPFNKRALSFLDKQIIKTSEVTVGEAAAKTGLRTMAKKGVRTTAKLGLKSVPIIGIGAGVTFDRASGIGWGQSITRNVVGDIAGGFTGGIGLVGGPIGAFAGGIGGQVGGELATDFLFKRANALKNLGGAKPLTEDEKKGLKNNMFMDVNTGRFMGASDMSIMSDLYRPSTQSVSNTRVASASKALASENSKRNAFDIYSSDAQNALSNPNSGNRFTASSVIAGKPTATDLRVQASSKYVGSSYSSGGSSSPARAAPTSRYAGTNPSVQRALSGPKVSAVGKYTSGGSSRSSSSSSSKKSSGSSKKTTSRYKRSYN